MSVNTTPPTIVGGSLADSTVVNEVLDGIQAPWDTYTPVVTTDGTSNPSTPTTAEGFYIRTGKTVHFRFRVDWTGSPTNGNGHYLFSLPFPVSSSMTGADAIGHGQGLATSTDQASLTALAGAGSGNCVLMGVWTNGSSSSANEVSATWGATAWDYRISGTYECA